MKLIKKILGKLNGLRYRQEYLCFPFSSLDKKLRLYLVEEGKVTRDLTELHCLVGYAPLVFALHSFSPYPHFIDLLFSETVFKINDIPSRKDAPARLYMKKIQELQTGNNTVAFYEGTAGHHQFLSFFHQFMIRLNNNLYGKKAGNVFLPGNQLEQVQIAYALPRKISLITVSQENKFNLFPTDLQGKAGDVHYLISLRHKGRACAMVEQSGNIVLSDVEAPVYKMVYALGKNHMQPMKEREAFPFSEASSKEKGLPLPLGSIGYKELELQDGFIYGIHKILVFRIIGEVQLNDHSTGLFHIHAVYATWRAKKGREGNYLLR